MGGATIPHVEYARTKLVLYQYFSRNGAAKPSSLSAKKKLWRSLSIRQKIRGVVVVTHTMNIQLRSMLPKMVQPKLLSTSPLLPEDRFPNAESKVEK